MFSIVYNNFVFPSIYGKSPVCDLVMSRDVPFHVLFSACFHAQTEGPKGQFAVEQLRIVEVLPPNLFGKEFPHVFQV